MGLSAFNRMRERQMTQAQVTKLEEQLATLKGEFIAFQNDPDAMKARIAELESSEGNQTPAGDQNPNEVQPINYAGLKVDELRAVLIEKGISFEPSAKKDELLALMPKE